MRSGVDTDRSYSGRRVQTILFHHEDAEWLRTNIGAARSLITTIQADGVSGERDRNRTIFAGVGVERVLEFLSNYQIHQNSREMDSDLLRRYILRQAENRQSLLEWNIVIVSRVREHDLLGSIDLGLEHPVPLINRARFVPRLGVRAGTADIKALMSTPDIVADIPELRAEAGGKSREALIQERTRGLPDHGCLLIYPVSGNSVPNNPDNPGPRQALNAVEDLIGVVFVFPEAVNDEPESYMTAREYVGEDIEAHEFPEDEELEQDFS